MTLIYEPKGKAREYSPLALNVYNGCDFGCNYCYTKIIKRSPLANCFAKERTSFLIKLEKELSKNIYTEQILLSFMCDPYCTTDIELCKTRGALKLLNANDCLVAVLTKSGKNCLRDIDIFKQFGKKIKVGATLTFIDEIQSKKIEPNAAPPDDRIETLKQLHKKGIKTFVSIEPVIDPEQSLELMEKTLTFTDHYKIGKMNYYEKNFPMIDWAKFLKDAVKLMRKNKKKFYIKKDLAKFDIDKKLKCCEIDHDALNIKR